MKMIDKKIPSISKQFTTCIHPSIDSFICLFCFAVDISQFVDLLVIFSIVDYLDNSMKICLEFDFIRSHIEVRVVLNVHTTAHSSRHFRGKCKREAIFLFPRCFFLLKLRAKRIWCLKLAIAVRYHLNQINESPRPNKQKMRIQIRHCIGITCLHCSSTKWMMFN